jgi:hypothetical protein
MRPNRYGVSIVVLLVVLATACSHSTAPNEPISNRRTSSRYHIPIQPAPVLVPGSDADAALCWDSELVKYESHAVTDYVLVQLARATVAEIAGHTATPVLPFGSLRRAVRDDDVFVVLPVAMERTVSVGSHQLVIATDLAPAFARAFDTQSQIHYLRLDVTGVVPTTGGVVLSYVTRMVDGKHVNGASRSGARGDLCVIPQEEPGPRVRWKLLVFVRLQSQS